MQPMHSSVYLTVEDLALRHHKSPWTIRSNATRAPHSLPPICRLPGCRRLLWRLEDVEAFEAGCVVQSAPQVAPASAHKRRRGRPTKVEQRARREAERRMASERAHD